MNREVTDRVDHQAGRVVGHSRIAALLDVAVDGAAASVRTSRVLRMVRDRTRAFQALPRAERIRCVLLTIAVALTGHIVMASMLPSRARPTPALTAAVLLGATAAAIAASARSR
jgi:hypothetical protein